MIANIKDIIQILILIILIVVSLIIIFYGSELLFSEICRIGKILSQL